MDIIGGCSSQLLASRIAEKIDGRLILAEFKTFPDGEQYTRLLDTFDDEVVIVQSTPTDSDFVNLLQLIDACTDAKITAVIPYMGYARQDKQFKDGEAVSARAIARSLNVSRVITVNIHEDSILSYFNTRAESLDATNLLAENLLDMDLPNPVIISPDKGAIYLARNAAAVMGADYDYLEKKRLSGDTVAITPKKLDIKGMDVIIIDDMISTGGTMAEAIATFKSEASSLHAACVHPVLTENAVLRLFHAGVKDIISTDTIEKGVSKVSVASLIASAL